MMTWEDLCKAPLDVITPEQVEALPRLCMERNRYGTTFVAIDAHNMIVGRGVVHFHCGDYAKRHPGVRFVSETLVDCPRCRKDRFYLQQEWRTAGLDDAGILKRLQDWRDDGDLYWCNDCQGTGWLIEPIEAAVARHGTITWQDVAMKMSGEELAELLNTPKFRLKIPEGVLKAEAARRLTALS